MQGFLFKPVMNKLVYKSCGYLIVDSQNIISFLYTTFLYFWLETNSKFAPLHNEKQLSHFIRSIRKSYST